MPQLSIKEAIEKIRQAQWEIRDAVNKATDCDNGDHYMILNARIDRGVGDLVDCLEARQK
jgi:hypothetical protein